MGSGSSSSAKAVQKPPPPAPAEVKPFVPFTDFPTPLKLSTAQQDYCKYRQQQEQQRNGATKKDGTAAAVPRDDDTPSPPRTTRAEMKLDWNRLQEIDNYCIKTPKLICVSGTLDLLVTHLVKPARNTTEKVRAIFAWIALQDLSGYNIFKMPSRDAPLFYLLLIRARLSSYTELFYQMCLLADIKVIKVTGYAKGCSYRIGGKVPYGHTWCVVYVDGSWRFVDQAWGSSSVSVSSDPDWDIVASDINQSYGAGGVMHYDIDDDYFFPDPEQLVYEHYTDEKHLQLLPRPITLEEFTQVAFLRNSFFKLGLTDVSQPKCVVESSTGDVTFEFDRKPDALLEFKYELFKAAGSKSLAEVGGKTLNNCACVKHGEDGVKKAVYVQLPVYGRYKLSLYARDVSNKNSRTFYDICEYVIDCKVPNFRMVYFPKLSGQVSEYGPGALCKQLGLVGVNYKDGIINSDTGLVEVSLEQILKTLQHLQLSLSLESVSSDGVTKQLQDYAVHYRDEQQHTFTCRLPNAGTYILTIRHTTERLQVTNICSYLIRSTVGYETDRPFPTFPFSQVGQLQKGDEAAVKPVSHRCPLIRYAGGDPITIAMETVKDAVYRWTLCYMKDQGQGPSVSEDCSEYVWGEREGSKSGSKSGSWSGSGKWNLHVRFHKVGIYVLTTITTTSGSVTETEQFRYLFIVDQSSNNCLPFPELEDDWSPSWRLIQPTNGILVAGQVTEFAVQLEGGIGSVMIQDDKRQTVSSLTRQADNKWTVTCPALQADTFVMLVAQHGSRRKDLLTFRTGTQVEIDEKKERADKEAAAEKAKLEQRKDAELLAAKQKQKDEDAAAQQAEKDFIEHKEEIVKKEEELVKEAEKEDAKATAAETENNINTDSTPENIDGIIGEQIKELAEEKDPDLTARKAAEKKMKDAMLRKHMRDATKWQDLNLLTEAVRKFKAANLEEQNGDLSAAEKKIALLTVKKDLAQAVANDDEKQIEALLQLVDERGYRQLLQSDVSRAEQRLRYLRRLRAGLSAVLAVDKPALAEVRSYSNPPPDVAPVFATVLLLLGYSDTFDPESDESHIAQWSQCRRHCTSKLVRQVTSFDPHLSLTDDVRDLARRTLESVEFSRLQVTCTVAVAFYVWAKGVIEDYEQ